MKKKTYPAINIGSASMLLVFIVLSLVTLSVLSLSSAASDYNYSKKIAARNTEYYVASNTAERLLSKIDQILAETWQSNPDDYDLAVISSLEQLSGIETDAMQTERMIAYTVEINDTSALNVELYIYPANMINDQFYSVKSWSTTTTREWIGEDSPHLLEGD